MDIYAASHKLKAFSIPEESLESRFMRRKAESMPVLTFGPSQKRQPDEEKGRKFHPVHSQESLDVKQSHPSSFTTFCDQLDADSLPDDWADDLIDDTPDTTLDSLDKLQLDTNGWQDKIWTNALSQAVELVNGTIGLQNHGLTYVPSEIIQLASIRSLPPLSKRTFTKAKTTSDLPSRARKFARTASATGSLSTPPPTAVPVSIILSNNKLSTASLPHELFCIPSLQTLALRHNEIETLSPAIGNCANLKELNLSNNRLTYLPAEILSLACLTNIYLVNNPFLPVPSEVTRTPTGRLLGPIKRHFTVPSLAEIALRIAIAKVPGANEERRHRTLRGRSDLPPHLASLLPDHKESTACKCDSPAHTDKDYVEYVSHAEERFEWIEEGRLRSDGGKGGQLIPILWRGCSKGCLDWLEE